MVLISYVCNQPIKGAAHLKIVKSETYVWFISYSKCSNWRQISKLSSNFGCLFTLCYLDGTNSIETDLHICNWTGQFVGNTLLLI